MGTQLYETEVRESRVQRWGCLWVEEEKQPPPAIAPAGGSERPQDGETWCFHLEWAGRAYSSS